MKWWYVLVLLAGVGIGWWILGKYQVNKTVVAPAVNSPAEKVTYDANWKEVPAVEVDGIVQKWHPDTGVVEFLRDNKPETLTVDPAWTVIFIPSKMIKDKVLRVVSKTGPRWQTAFCPGDFIDFRLAGDKIVMATSSGYRSCGFRGQ